VLHILHSWDARHWSLFVVFERHTWQLFKVSGGCLSMVLNQNNWRATMCIVYSLMKGDSFNICQFSNLIYVFHYYTLVLVTIPFYFVIFKIGQVLGCLERMLMTLSSIALLFDLLYILLLYVQNYCLTVMYLFIRVKKSGFLSCNFYT